MTSKPTLPNSSFRALRRFVRDRSEPESCELCGAAIAADHPHLVEPANRKLSCACGACSILFSGQSNRRYRRVPRTIRFLPDFRLTDAQWDGLMIPISLAFFFHSTPANRIVAFYPSPAGPTESLLTSESWEAIVSDNLVVRNMEPDVEALLVNRVTRTQSLASPEYYIAPIDECYRLVGLIRAHWRGLSGGVRVWDELGRFFSSLKDRSIAAKESVRA